MFAFIMRTRRAPRTLRPANSRARRPLQLERVESRVLLAAPEIAVLHGVSDIVSGSTAPIDFGTVNQGSVGPTRIFSIENDGDESLTLGAITLPAGFTLVEGTSNEIAVRGSDTFTIRLDSAATGLKTGFVRFSTNDSDENPFTFAITGTVLAGGPEITVLNGAAPILDGTVVPVDFGAAVIGQAGPTRTFVVRNDGTQPLTIGTINLPSGFILTDGLPAALLPGISDSFSVQLATAAAAAPTGQITFATNDTDENPFNFVVTGRVTPFDGPEITVLDGVTPIADGSLVPVQFAAGVLGRAEPTRTFTVRNDGTAALTLGTPVVPAGFTLLDGLPNTLAPRATASFTVQLDTTAVGSPTGQISIATSDADENPFNFPIAGTVAVASAEIRVFREDVVELFNGAPQVAIFVPAGVGQFGATWSFEVINEGTGRLTLGPITLPAGFKLLDGLSPRLEPGRSDIFTVQLDTTTAGDKVGDILIPCNDADENPFHISVRGTVLGTPEIAVQSDGGNILDGGAAALEFGDGVQRDAAPQRTFVVRNTGGTALSLGAITLPGGYTLLDGLRDTLGPGASDSFTVQLSTAVAGTFAGEISIINNDPDESPFNFPITARVTQRPAPEISVFDSAAALVSGDPAMIDFGSVTRRQRGPTRTFTIRNDGSETLRVSRIELPPGFSLLREPRRNLSPRGSDTFVLRLDSKQVGFKAGQILIFNDDSDESVFRIAISGTVLA